MMSKGNSNNNRFWMRLVLVHYSVWLSATSAFQRTYASTSPKCYRCSKTPPCHGTTSDPSCVSTPEATISCRPRDVCLWEKILLATPLLQWYLAHGLVVEHVYQIIEFQPNPCFRRFGESVSTARREGDSDPNKTIIADTIKLIGNSGYGKTVTDVDRHRDVQYCTDVGASMFINNRRFHQLDVVVDNAYEVEMEKKVIKYSLPHHIGFFVYQYAK